MKKRYLVLLSTLMISSSLTGCKSNKVVVTGEDIIAKQASLAALAESTQGTVEVETESTVAETKKSGPENSGVRPDEANEVKVIKNKEIESTIIEDEEKKTEIINNLREKLKEQKSSYKMNLLLNFELIKLSKSTGDGPRYYFTLERERRQNEKYYYSVIKNTETYAGNKAINNVKTYLLDNGEKTFSYSKEFDSLRDIEDKIDWLGVTVDRDLESEIISFEQIDENLMLDVYEITEEQYDGVDCYTLRCLYPLPRALELIGINPVVAEVDEENSKDFKATIKLYVDRSDYELTRFEVTCMDALKKYYDSYYNNEESEEPWKMEIHKCNAGVNVGDYHGVRIDIPKEITARLPEDLRLAANGEFGQAVTVDDKDSITLDGDFAIGVSDEHKNSAESSSSETEENSESNSESVEDTESGQ